MKPCDHLSPYLDGRLERAGRDYFETHLHICSECREVVNAWMCAKNGLKKEALERRKQLTPTDDEAAKLVEWAVLDQSSRGFGSAKVLVPLTAAISFVLAFWIGIHWSNDTGKIMEEPVKVVQPAVRTEKVAPIVASFEPALEYATNDTGHTTGRLGNDQFGLAPSSKLAVVSTSGKDTVLKLEKGIAAFQVSPRKRGERFIVEAGAYRVLVVGTRFSVDSRGDRVRVAVAEGIVEVSEEGGRGWRLVAGEALSVALDGKAERLQSDDNETTVMARLLGELPFEPTLAYLSEDEAASDDVDMHFDFKDVEEPVKTKRWNKRRNRRRAKSATPAAEEMIALNTKEHSSEGKSSSPAESVDELGLGKTPPPKGVDLWRQWILDGRFEAAEAALVAHLENNPVDTDAYSLLADCRRKAGKYAEAIDTYKKLTAIAGEYQANRARFKAGVLMQENLKNHLGAAAIFDEYLATGKGTPLLRAKATVRLARSLIKLGETERATVLLRRVIDGYSGSSVAIQAREILNKMD